MPLVIQSQQWIARLRGFLMQPERDNECCELCGLTLESEHPHLAEPAERRLLCACTACAVLFADDTGGRYRLVPTETAVLHDFHMSDEQWEVLGIPINLAFFFYSTPDDRLVALYPGPGGPTESGLDLSAWHELAAMNPILDRLRPDVEAVLVNRIGGAREYYRVPIDRCYALVGAIRRRWSGFGGGAEVERAIREFCAGLAPMSTGESAWCYA